ncbi:MAG TPA: TonB-dependent receptor [Bryobacteraceae bacterium]|nr:TonB-dependent receptor [Bryobacteraceae bacterium]
MRTRILPVFLSLLAPACLAQSTPADQQQPTVVTGAFDPVSFDEMDRVVTVSLAREQELLLKSIVDLLELDPSIDLQERAPDGVQTDLSIRGSNFGQTLVLLNGERLNDAQSGHHDMDIPVPLAAISRVETLQGAGSTLYGSDAVAGAINVITEPPEGLDARIRTAFGNYGSNQQSVSLADTLGSVSEQIVASRDFSEGFMPDRDYRNLQFSSSTHYDSRLGAGDLTLAYMDHPFGANQFYGDFDSWENTKTWLAAWRQKLGKKTSVSFAYRRHSDDFVLFRENPSIYANHHSDESFQGAVRRTETLASYATLNYGVEALSESIISNNLGIHQRARGAAYGSLDLRALRRFSLSIAAREEIYRYFSAEFCPTVSGGVWLSSKWKLRASASRAFRVPSYTDLYYEDPANLGNPNLRPERSWTYEAGAVWNPIARVRVDLGVFERRERDDIDYFRTNPDALWMALNIDNLNFSGVEGSVRWTPVRSQTIDFSYTGLRATEDTVPIGQTKYTFQYPKQTGIVAWEAGFANGVMFRTRLAVRDRYGVGPYALLDASAAYSRGRFRPFVELTNITGTSYQEVQGVDMPGITAMGGVELSLK